MLYSWSKYPDFKNFGDSIIRLVLAFNKDWNQ